MKICALLMSPEKLRKFNAKVMCDENSSRELRFIQLTSVEELNEARPDCIIHKVPEFLLTCGDTECVSVRQFQNFLDKNPQVVCIDPLENVRRITRRNDQFVILERLFKNSDLANTVCVPKFCLLSTNDSKENVNLLQQTGIRFPIIVKKQVAHGDKNAHSMALIFNEAGLKQFQYPAIAQEFINHNGKLFKVFTIGRQTFVFVRPSIRNLSVTDNHEIISFDSRTVSKYGQYSPLCDDIQTAPTNQEPDADVDRALLGEIAMLIREATKLDLFGVDVIRYAENEHAKEGSSEAKWAVIDINICPSYDQVPYFHRQLENLVREKLALPLVPIPEER